MSRSKGITLLITVALILLISACGEPDVQVETVEVPVEVTRVVEKVVTQQVTRQVSQVVEKVVTVEVPQEPEGDIPFAAEWISSPHADTEAEAFTHWDEDDPAEVPARCAKCHSTAGYRDFLGVDGTIAGQVDNPAPVGSVVTCEACHNEATLHMTSVVFPSGIEVTGLGDEARCMQCHQGRASMVQVDRDIEEAAVTGPDEVSSEIGFTNIHYYAAAATRLGTWVKGGYQYEGLAYDARFGHVEGFDTCTECHDMHTLALRLDDCATCHQGVTTVEDLRDIRMAGSLVDYDGDGNLEEGIYYELQDLRDILYQAMQTYSQEVAGATIVYNADRYPYFFNEDGERYGNWTARLAKAAYNYQVSLKDPGAYAHGGKYIIELLYDAVADLNQALADPLPMADLHRIDHGHFAGSEEAFRHWDEDGEIRASCAKCHSATGLPTFMEEGVNVSEPPSNGLQCATCHSSQPEYALREVSDVTFPSGATVSLEDPGSNLCLNCHQGRESTDSVRQLTAGLPDDETSPRLRFLNVHYFAAGATLFGAEARGAYQYQGQAYVGRNAHVPGFDTCTECHSAHRLQVAVDSCSGCHEGVETAEDLPEIRMGAADYDGDGDTQEGLASELDTLQEILYEAMQTYASDVAGTGIVYNPHRYPYYFDDAGERFASWTPRLLRAAYNYQYAQKDPGAFAHNPRYVAQVLQDSIRDLATQIEIEVPEMVRPPGASSS